MLFYRGCGVSEKGFLRWKYFRDNTRHFFCACFQQIQNYLIMMKILHMKRKVVTAILEVKFDSFLPPFISELLYDIPKVNVAISKYCKCYQILNGEYV